MNSLLEIPWQRVSPDDEFPIPIFKRGLEIPEYDVKFIKHLNPKVTLFSGFWISENRFCPDSPFCKIPFYKLPEIAYYAGTNEEFDLSEVNKILETYDGFIVELDALIHIPELRSEYEHEKGVYVEQVEADIVSVNGLAIEHPGHKVAGIGANRGWYFKIEGERWRRINHEDQCPCNNNLRHELQFSLLRALNESLKNGDIIKLDEYNYSHKDINYV